MQVCLSSLGALSGLNNLGDLIAGADDALTSGIINVSSVLVLGLGTLPDFDLTSTTEHTNTHGREKVVSGIGVQIDTSVENGSSVFANGRGDQSLATRVLLDEVANIVDDTSDDSESLAVLALVNEIIPANDGELIQRSTPVEDSTLLVQLLLKLLNTALFDFVGAELLEIVGEAEPLPHGDGPLGGVILPPLNSVAVVRGELVVEVVVSLTKSGKGSDDVVTRRVAVVEGLVSEPVGKRIHAEGGLLDEPDTKDATIDEAADPVTPTEATDKRGEDKSHRQDTLDEVAVLPDNDGVLVEIGDIGTAGAFGILLHDHPAEVGVQETLANGVRILLGVGVAVVSTVIP